MEDGFGLIFLVDSSARWGQSIHGMFLGSKESLFRVYFGSSLVPINEYGFRPHEVQSWLRLIKMLGSYHIFFRLIS
jgi:hypothetical protein